MRASGYSKASAKNPKNLTESRGFAQICEENGLTQSFVLKALVSDIKKKPTKRSEELRIAVDILGMKKQSPVNNILVINIPPDKKNMVEQALDSYFENDTQTKDTA